MKRVSRVGCLLATVAIAACGAAPAEDAETSSDALLETRNSVSGQSLVVFDFPACPDLDPRKASPSDAIACTYLKPEAVRGLRFTASLQEFNAARPLERAYVFKGPAADDDTKVQWYGVLVAPQVAGGSLHPATLHPTVTPAALALLGLDPPLLIGAALLGAVAVFALPQRSLPVNQLAAELERSLATSQTSAQDDSDTRRRAKTITVYSNPNAGGRIQFLPPRLFVQAGAGTGGPVPISVVNKIGDERFLWAAAASKGSGGDISFLGRGVPVEPDHAVALPSLFCAEDYAYQLDTEYVGLKIGAGAGAGAELRAVSVECQYVGH